MNEWLTTGQKIPQNLSRQEGSCMLSLDQPRVSSKAKPVVEKSLAISITNSSADAKFMINAMCYTFIRKRKGVSSIVIYIYIYIYKQDLKLVENW